jgi:hypothetical protein
MLRDALAQKVVSWKTVASQGQYDTRLSHISKGVDVYLIVGFDVELYLLASEGPHSVAYVSPASSISTPPHLSHDVLDLHLVYTCLSKPRLQRSPYM